MHLFSLQKNPWGRRARWITELQKCDFNMKFVECYDNPVADASSRLEVGNARVIGLLRCVQLSYRKLL